MSTGPWSNPLVKRGVVSGAASNNAVILKLNAPVSYGATVSYAGHAATVAPWVANAAGVGLLAFYNVPVTAPDTLSSRTLAASAVSASLRFSFPTVRGRLYSVECCPNLGSQNWQSLPYYVWGTGGMVQFTNAPSQNSKFYRLKISSY